MSNYLNYNSTAEADIATYRFVKQGTADDSVVQATAGAKIQGISEYIVKANKAVSVVMVGQFKIECGGVITRGDKLKSDATGKGITASVNQDEYGAVAQRSGVLGDIIPVIIEKGQANI
jgi:hypothetical protein